MMSLIQEAKKSRDRAQVLHAAACRKLWRSSRKVALDERTIRLDLARVMEAFKVLVGTNAEFFSTLKQSLDEAAHVEWLAARETCTTTLGPSLRCW